MLCLLFVTDFLTPGPNENNRVQEKISRCNIRDTGTSLKSEYFRRIIFVILKYVWPVLWDVLTLLLWLVGGWSVLIGLLITLVQTVQNTVGTYFRRYFHVSGPSLRRHKTHCPSQVRSSYFSKHTIDLISCNILSLQISSFLCFLYFWRLLLLLDRSWDIAYDKLIGNIKMRVNLRINSWFYVILTKPTHI